MNRPPTIRASGLQVFPTTVLSSAVVPDVTLSVYPVTTARLPPSTSRLYLTSLLVIGTPSDHLAPFTRWNVTVFLSGETSQLSARPVFDGPRLSGLNATSRSYWTDQTRKYSSA